MNRDDIPPLPKQNSKRLAMLFHRKRVQGITKKLYTPQAVSADVLASRNIKSQINLLKSASIRISRCQPTSSFSSIRTLSVSLLQDLVKSKRRPDLSFSQTDLEDTGNIEGNKGKQARMRPSILEMKSLSQQMSPALHRNEEVLKEEEEKKTEKTRETRNNTSKNSRQRGETQAESVDAVAVYRDMETIKSKGLHWNRKIKLHVTSIALMEDEIRALAADCMEFKRNMLKKKLETAYSALRKARREKDICREQYLRLGKLLKSLNSMPVTPFLLD